MYFSKGESQCRICECLFTSVAVFDRHLNPLPQKGCIGRDGLLADPKDGKGRSKFGMVVRRNPDGTSREVWRADPWKEHFLSVTSQEPLEGSEGPEVPEDPAAG